MTNECEVYFKLYGDDFDPNIISETIGLEPTRTRRKGEPRAKFSFWILSIGKVESEAIDVYEMASKLVKKIKPHKDKIIKAIKAHGLSAELQVVLWIPTDESISTPAIGFETETIQFLSDIGASIDIDSYKKS